MIDSFKGLLWRNEIVKNITFFVQENNFLMYDIVIRRMGNTKAGE